MTNNQKWHANLLSLCLDNQSQSIINREDTIIHALTTTHLPENIDNNSEHFSKIYGLFERFEELAAIMEYDANLSRDHVERLAWNILMTSSNILV